MKKIFLFTLLAFVFFIAPKVNAQVVSFYAFDSSFNTVQSQASPTFTASPCSPLTNATYFRWTFNDTLEANQPYTIYFTISYTTTAGYFDTEFNQGGAGININGSYQATAPTSKQTLASSLGSNTVCGSSTVQNYYRQVSYQYQFTPTVSTNSFFFQMRNTANGYSRASLDAYDVQEYVDPTQSIINNQTQNTTNIINNNNSNTTAIINNQNQNSQQQIDSQKVCEVLNSSYVVDRGSYLTSSGYVATSADSYGISDYINISDAELTVVDPTTAFTGAYSCFYRNDKTIISCVSSDASSITIPSGAFYFRFTSQLNSDRPLFKLCKNGNQALNDYMTDTNVNIGGHVIEAPTTSHPISSIITAPISFLESLDDTCTPISFNLGFPGTTTRTITLPCGDTIFWNRTDLNYVQEFRLFWNILFGGALLYFFGFKLFKAFEKALDPFETGVNDLEV